MPAKPNPGRMPEECVFETEDGDVRYRNVRVWFFNGTSTPGGTPGGWPSYGKGAVRWSISKPPHPFDIQFYEVV